jgi:hypothetical protein
MHAPLFNTPVMKEHYRLLLLPLKLPKIAKTINQESSPLINAASPIAYPFLFVHLGKSLTKLTNPSTGLHRRSVLTRFLNWGEAKWQEYGEASPRSIKGFMHRIGTALLNKIPVTEKQLWRLHALQQHISHCGPNRPSTLEIETGSTYLDNSITEQSVRFDLMGQLNSWAAFHRRWSIFSGVLIVPMAILSILPFGKLFLAWIIFRAVAHWRAYQGSHFLIRCFNYDRQDSISDILPAKFINNPLIDRHLPLPPTYTPETRSFTDPFANLARDLDLGELTSVLPRALKLVIDREKDRNGGGGGPKRRKFSNQNLLEP